VFLDEVTLHLSAGKGGDGVIAWRREKYIPKGGPTGGNGGRGGSVIFRADPQLYSLDYFRFRKILKGENGVQGGPNLQQGRSGKDLIIKVPCGTVIRNASTKELIVELLKEGDEIVLCKGGKGGKGNDHFKSPTNRAPHTFTKGDLGEELEVDLELKLIADVGLVGFPNAGKSSLINALARGRAKVGAYPFTTLTPNLGFIETLVYDRIFVADIPGIIRGASDNRGLGLEFLRHIDRTKLIVFVVDGAGTDARDPLDDFKVLRDELSNYSPELLDRPSFLLINKTDAIEEEKPVKALEKKAKALKIPTFRISALTGDGLDTFKEAIIHFFSK
jgi:GTP-binding protein